MTGNRDKKAGESLPNAELEQINARRWQIRYNFVEKPAITGDMAMPASYQYDFVNVGELTKKTIKEAIIRTKYDHNDEFSVINDQTTKPTNYASYQSLRTLADVVIGKVI